MIDKCETGTMTPPSIHKTPSMGLLLSATTVILVTLCASSTDAFSTIAPTTTTMPRYRSLDSTTRTKTTTTRTNTARYLMPFPVEEKEKAKREDNNDDDDDTLFGTDKAWTKVDGGFLPNLGTLHQRLTRKTKETSYAKPTQPLIAKASNLQEYRREVALAEQDLVVVRFYAPWCRACKAAGPYYRRLARQYQQKKHNVKFVEVPIAHENAVLFQGLGVKSVPFGHVYHKEAGLVEERKLKAKDMKAFTEVLDTYVKGECAIPQNDYDQEENHSHGDDGNAGVSGKQFDL